MPSEGPEARSETGKPAEPPKVVHADGTLTVTEDTVEIEVTRGGGFRGMIAVPLDRCTLRVMGRAIAVFDEGRLVHLCSRSKPAAEVASLVARVGDRATVIDKATGQKLIVSSQGGSETGMLNPLFTVMQNGTGTWDYNPSVASHN